MNNNIQTELKNKKFISEQDIFFWAKNLEESYGIAFKYSLIVIERWAEVFGLTVPKVKYESQSETEETKKNSAVTVGDIIWENDQIRVQVKDITKSNFFNGKFDMESVYINFVLTNMTDEEIFVKLFDIAINGIVIEEDYNLSEIRPNKTKAEKVILSGHKLVDASFTSFADLKELSFEVSIGSSKYFKYNSAIDSMESKLEINL